MANAETQWTSLEHDIYRDLKSRGVQGSACLLAVSGGLDSIALLQMFARLQSALNLKLGVFHCHHGPAKTPAQTLYRDQALKFVLAEAEKRGLPFFSSQSTSHLSSENDMREFRRFQIQKIQEEHHFDWIVWAHHQEDFLETQILRMIRGAGKEAIAEPMLLQKEFELRPFLKIAKSNLKIYLHNQKLLWLEDPSNEEDKYLRNWIRNTWLPQLEEKCPGALKSLSRSLDLLQENFDDQFPEGLWLENGISRPLFLTLNDAQKKQCLALYLKSLGQREFSHNQLLEILKHLDNPQLNHTFKSAQMIWSFSKDLIYVKAPFVVNAN